MFDFHKYPSIDNSYRTKTISQVKHHKFDKVEWIVLLKLHGANFSIWSDGKTVQPAKRTSFIKEGENFNNWERVVDEISDNVISLYNSLKQIYPDIKEVVLWGELAGGEYPHPNVKKSNHSKRVQKGVYYAPFNFFYMFDITIDGMFISHDIVQEMGEINGIIAAEPLKRGVFEDCLEYPNQFLDPFYKNFGLPELTKDITGKDNICEGVIIKPVHPLFFGNGSRCILKNKNDIFKENNGEKKNKVPKEKHKWSVNGARLYTLISTYVSENRLRNVLSHGIEIGQKDFGKLMKELNIDTWDDFIKDNDDFEYLDIVEQKLIKSSLNALSSNLIRPNFQNIVDGEY